MMRLAAVLLVAVVVGFPVGMLPTVPVGWLSGAAFVVAGAGALALSVPLVTAGASLAVIAYALALVVGRAAPDPVGAAVFGGTLVVVLALVHLAGRTREAALGPSVIASQVRQWLVIAATGTAVALALTLVAGLLAGALAGAAPPTVVIAAVLGAVLAAAGVVALMTRAEPLRRRDAP